MGSRITILKGFFNPVFVFLGVIFLLHQIAQPLGLSTTFLRSYLDDFLALPLLFFVATLLLRLVYNRPQLQLDWPMMITGFLLLIVVFEWVLPEYSSSYTRDWWDVVAYALGWILWLFLRKSM